MVLHLEALPRRHRPRRALRRAPPGDDRPAEPPDPSSTTTRPTSPTSTTTTPAPPTTTSTTTSPTSTTTSPTSTGTGTTSTTTSPTTTATGTPTSTTTSSAPADHRAPVTTLVSGPAQGTRVAGTTATLAFHSDEAGSTFDCRLDDDAWSGCDAGSVAYATSQIGYGVHTFSVRAVDQAGNADTSPVTRVWTTISTTPGKVRPDASNTGVPAGATLTDYWGDLTVTTPGTVVDRLDVHGFLRIMADDVTVKRSRIRGGVASYDAGNRSLLSSTKPGAVIEDVELVPDFPSVRIDGLKGYGFTARRVNIHGTVDTALVFGDDTSITNSWLHDNRHYLVDPNQRNTPSHDDGVQVQGGHHIRIAGNRIPDADNAGLMVTQDHSITSDLQFTDNWADGGGCTVNVAEKGKGPIQGLVVSENRFGRNTAVTDCPVIAPATTPLTAERNVYDDTGSPARIRRNG
ncbi:hypothetical protein GCM10025868_14480 [Angustibacter aerolatus]|uniref:Right handed beta helix domain-containing protein n=1 Tax=Angustibacter aerolatus TaxID=1162965 RepID=A0ABQ6JDD3_9ACTN|nr:right-handed parallel beta-helix repeat-containing protein [Angustibacter aerolatus]GMA86198.1 hypothetical protein GCM10025868_14480 [Angustibacter aerolatus]